MTPDKKETEGEWFDDTVNEILSDITPMFCTDDEEPNRETQQSEGESEGQAWNRNPAQPRKHHKLAGDWNQIKVSNNTAPVKVHQKVPKSKRELVSQI